MIHMQTGCLKIATNMGWPSFRNVALDVQKALKPYCDSMVFDWREVEPRGRILLMETIRKDTLRSIRRLLPGSNIVFYGTTEGHSLLDKESLRLAEKVKVVAVSGFVKQMLEEVNVHVAGVVHHGLDFDAKSTDPALLSSAAEKTRDRIVSLTVASNDPRKGLKELLEAYKSVEGEVDNSFLVLHSQPKWYSDPKDGRLHERCCDLPSLASVLGIERLWLTEQYGEMTSEELNALYSLCHIYVFPSFSEGFGLPTLEAFRFDKPVVAVDAPPFNEVVEDGKTGRLIPFVETRWFDYKGMVLFKMHVYEPDSLREAMVSLLTDRRSRESMAAEIHERKRNWSIHVLYPRLLGYF